jgi:hypothetical protein
MTHREISFYYEKCGLVRRKSTICAIPPQRCMNNVMAFQKDIQHPEKVTQHLKEMIQPQRRHAHPAKQTI